MGAGSGIEAEGITARFCGVRTYGQGKRLKDECVNKVRDLGEGLEGRVCNGEDFGEKIWVVAVGTCEEKLAECFGD